MKDIYISEDGTLHHHRVDNIPEMFKLVGMKEDIPIYIKKDWKREKKQKAPKLKEYKFRPMISKHDLTTKCNQARKHFDNGNRIKFSLFLRQQIQRPLVLEKFALVNELMKVQGELIEKNNYFTLMFFKGGKFNEKD